MNSTWCYIVAIASFVQRAACIIKFHFQLATSYANFDFGLNLDLDPDIDLLNFNGVRRLASFHWYGR